MGSTTSGKIVQIQSLRGLAALAVVLQHSWHEFDKIKTKSLLKVDENSLFPWEAGVDVFFVISGFIMWISASRMFGEPGGPYEFMRRRIVRIVPLYWLCSLLVLGVLIMAPGVFDRVTLDWSHVFASFLFFPSISEAGLRSPILIPGWTLNYEMMFYVIFALAMMFGRKLGLGIILGALALLSVAGLWIGPESVAPYFWTRPIILEFAAGIVVGICYERGIAINRLTSILLFFGALAVLTTAFQIWGRDPWRLLQWGLPAAALVASIALHPPRSGALLTRPVFTLFGDASYSLYLSHSFTIGIVVVLWHAIGAASFLPDWSFLLGAVAASMAGSLLLYFLFELPVGNLLRTVGQRQRVEGSGLDLKTPTIGGAVRGSATADPQ